MSRWLAEIGTLSSIVVVGDDATLYHSDGLKFSAAGYCVEIQNRTHCIIVTHVQYQSHPLPHITFLQLVNPLLPPSQPLSPPPTTPPPAPRVGHYYTHPISTLPGLCLPFLQLDPSPPYPLLLYSCHFSLPFLSTTPLSLPHPSLLLSFPPSSLYSLLLSLTTVTSGNQSFFMYTGLSVPLVHKTAQLQLEIAQTNLWNCIKMFYFYFFKVFN